jgi:flagellar motor switch protein FliG
MDAPTVADLIKNEHPQIIATILVHLEHDQASDILNQFTERLRNDVVLRIATLEGIQPEALKEFNDVMLRLLSGSANIKKSAMGGVRTVAEILNFMGTANETAVSTRSANTTPIWRRRSSTKCSSSRTCSTSTTAASSCCCAKSSPIR